MPSLAALLAVLARTGGVPAALALGFLLGTAAAGERPGRFDLYLLALSWNASWCEAEGDAREAPQCDPRHDHGFVLHGLWPQREADWPEHCDRAVPDPSRRDTAAMADLYGSAGLAWHQWKKHGRCSGLAAADYFGLARAAAGRVHEPRALRRLERTVRIDPAVIAAAFLEANPWLVPEALVVTCPDGLIREVRICLARDLAPRPCPASVRRGCRASRALLPPVR